MTPGDEELVEATLRRAREIGCTCDPEVELREIEPGIYSALMMHEDWCPLVRPN